MPGMLLRMCVHAHMHVCVCMHTCVYMCMSVRERDGFIWGLLKQIVESCPQFLLRWVLDRAENLHF